MAEEQQRNTCPSEGSVSSMSQERLVALNTLLELSLKMQQQAEAHQWLDVIQTGIERKRLIEQFFNQPVMEEESERVADILKKMLQVNEKVEMLAVDGRGDAGENINCIKQGRRAMLAYAKNTGDAATTR